MREIDGVPIKDFSGQVRLLPYREYKRLTQVEKIPIELAKYVFLFYILYFFFCISYYCNQCLS